MRIRNRMMTLCLLVVSATTMGCATIYQVALVVDPDGLNSDPIAVDVLFAREDEGIEDILNGFASSSEDVYEWWTHPTRRDFENPDRPRLYEWNVIPGDSGPYRASFDSCDLGDESAPGQIIVIANYSSEREDGAWKVFPVDANISEYRFVLRKAGIDTVGPGDEYRFRQ